MIEQKLIEHKDWFTHPSSSCQRGNICHTNLNDYCFDELTLSKIILNSNSCKNASFQHTSLDRADLRNNNFTGSNFTGAILNHSDLRGSNLTNCDLSNASLCNANLNKCNLSGCIGLLDPIEFLCNRENFESDDLGILCYKIFFQDEFSLSRRPRHWKIEENSQISEVVNPDRTSQCGSGVHVGTYNWCKANLQKYSDPIWLVRIKWKHLAGVVVPYNTDGKFRCSRATLVCPAMSILS